MCHHYVAWTAEDAEAEPADEADREAEREEERPAGTPDELVA